MGGGEKSKVETKVVHLERCVGVDYSREEIISYVFTKF